MERRERRKKERGREEREEKRHKGMGRCNDPPMHIKAQRSFAAHMTSLQSGVQCH